MEPSNGAFFLQWNDFQANASSTFKEMRDDNDFVDVTLACDDNYNIKAHKMVLAASSSFFSNFLKQNHHPSPFIYLKGIKVRALTYILDFMYNGEVNILHEDLDDFMKVGDDLKVKGVEKEESHVQAYSLNKGCIPKKQRKTKDKKEKDVDKQIIVKEQKPIKYESSGSDIVLVDTLNEEISNIGMPSNKENKYLQQEQMFIHLDSVILPQISKLKGVYGCKECGFQSKHTTNMKNHIESNHLNTKDTKIPCLHCDVSTHTRTGLRNHVKQYHTRI